MRGLVALTLMLTALSGCSPAATAPLEEVIQKEPVRPFPEATTVRLFIDSGKYDRSGNPVYLVAKGRTLIEQQRKQFEALLRVETPINVPPDSDYWVLEACFIPHHFFRYYDAAGRKLGEISVCFCCSGVAMDPASQLGLHDEQRFAADYGKLERLVASWGEPTDIECN